MAMILFVLVVLVFISINKSIGDKPLANGAPLVILIAAYFAVELVDRGL